MEELRDRKSSDHIRVSEILIPTLNTILHILQWVPLTHLNLLRYSSGTDSDDFIPKDMNDEKLILESLMLRQFWFNPLIENRSYCSISRKWIEHKEQLEESQNFYLVARRQSCAVGAGWAVRLQKEFIFIGSTDLNPISICNLSEGAAVVAIKNNVGHKHQKVYRKCFALFCVYQDGSSGAFAVEWLRINHLSPS